MPELGPKPIDIPYDPATVYKNDGWISVGDWLGNEFIAYSKREYLSYEEAKAFVHKLNLKNSTEWSEYCSGNLPDKTAKPETISNRPEITYKEKDGLAGMTGLGYPIFLHIRTIESSKRAENLHVP
jgi:hypothetical protein